MTLNYYMDVHIPRAITAGLRSLGVDVLTAQEDNSATQPDDKLLQRATALGRVLFSQDEDLLSIAAGLQARGIPFAGVIYVHQQRLAIGQCIQDLHVMAAALDPEEMKSRVEYLPL